MRQPVRGRRALATMLPDGTPKMFDYIFGATPQQTITSSISPRRADCCTARLQAVRDTVAKVGSYRFVGTKRQAQERPSRSCQAFGAVFAIAGSAAR